MNEKRNPTSLEIGVLTLKAMYNLVYGGAEEVLGEHEDGWAYQECDCEDDMDCKHGFIGVNTALLHHARRIAAQQVAEV
jgi:hypothetical protein